MDYPYAYALTHLLLLYLLGVALAVLVIEHLRRAHGLCRCEEWFSVSQLKSITAQSPSNDGGSGMSNNNRSRHQKNNSSQSFVFLTGEMSPRQVFAKSMTGICVLTSLVRHALGIYIRMEVFHLTVTPSSCLATIQCYAAVSTVIKFSLYCIFISRIDMSFQGTIYAYSKRVLQLCYAFIAFYFFIVLIWGVFAVDSDIQRFNFARNGARVSSDSQRRLKRCFGQVNPIFSTIVVLFDVIIISTLVTMFVRPLRRMYANRASVIHVNQQSLKKQTNQNPTPTLLTVQQIRKLELDLLPIKYTVLSIVSVLTSGLAVVGIAVGYGIGFTLDNLFNVASLLLMSQHWTPDYWFVCGPLLKSLWPLGCVSEGTHQSITLMSAHFTQMRIRKQQSNMSIAHKVLNSDSSVGLELGSDVGSLNNNNEALI